MGKYANLFKIAITLILVLLVIVLFKHYHLNQYLGLEGFNTYSLRILEIKTQSPYTFISVYMLSYFLLIALCIPGTVMLDILAGFLFGIFWGSILVTISYTLATIGNYLLVHYLFHDFFINRLKKFNIKISATANAKQKFLSLTALRLVPVIPFWALNILASVIKLPFRLFILSTMIGILPATIIYAIVGDGTRDTVLSHNKLSPNMLMDTKIWLPLVALSVLTLLPSIIKKIKR